MRLSQNDQHLKQFTNSALTAMTSWSGELLQWPTSFSPADLTQFLVTEDFPTRLKSSQHRLTRHEKLQRSK